MGIVGGVDFSAARKNPNETWLAVGEISSLGMQIKSIEKVGSQNLKSALAQVNDMRVCGLDFPFSLPTEFLRFLERKLSREEYQEWQEVAMQLVFLSFEQFQGMVEEYDIEPKRFTDKNLSRKAQSPLHKANPSMAQMTYHGMRILASLDPQKYYIPPFQEKVKDGCAVLEVYPREILYLLGLPYQGYKTQSKTNQEAAHTARKDIINGLIGLRERGDQRFADCPRLEIDNSIKGKIIASDHAVDAIVCCYAAGLYASQPELFPDPLDANNLNILLEGWIYAPSKLAQK